MVIKLGFIIDISKGLLNLRRLTQDHWLCEYKDRLEVISIYDSREVIWEGPYTFVEPYLYRTEDSDRFFVYVLSLNPSKTKAISNHMELLGLDRYTWLYFNAGWYRDLVVRRKDEVSLLDLLIDFIQEPITQVNMGSGYVELLSSSSLWTIGLRVKWTQFNGSVFIHRASHLSKEDNQLFVMVNRFQSNSYVKQVGFSGVHKDRFELFDALSSKFKHTYYGYFMGGI